MQSNYEKKSFEIFDRLNIYEKFKVMKAEKSTVTTRALRARLTVEEEHQFWQILDNLKKYAQNFKELLTLSLLRRDIMQDILNLFIKLVQDQPFKKTDIQLLEVVSQIQELGLETVKLGQEMLGFIEEQKLLNETCSLAMNNLPQMTFDMNPDKINATSDFFEKLTDIKNPQNFINQTRALEAGEIFHRDKTRKIFVSAMKNWLEII